MATYCITINLQLQVLWDNIFGGEGKSVMYRPLYEFYMYKYRENPEDCKDQYKTELLDKLLIWSANDP